MDNEPYGFTPPPAPSQAPQTPPPAPAPANGNGRFWKGCLISFIIVFFVIPALSVLFISIGIGCFVSKMADEDMSAKVLAVHDGPATKDLDDLNRMAGSVDAENAKTVLRIVLKGTISGDERVDPWSLESDHSAAAALRTIRKATRDPAIDAILLEIDSPGGEVTASDVVYDSLCRFRKAREGRFVVARMGATACSGAYYIVAAADYIVASPTTLTGSIGVKMESLNIRELAEKIGVKSVSVASGKNKNILSPFEDLTPEQEAMLRGMVDGLFNRFVDLVAEGRHLTREQVLPYADGRVFLAPEALSAGLIDEVGYLEETLSATGRLLGAPPRFVQYEEDGGFFKKFLSPAFVGASIRAAMPAPEEISNHVPTF